MRMGFPAKLWRCLCPHPRFDRCLCGFKEQTKWIQESVVQSNEVGSALRGLRPTVMDAHSSTFTIRQMQRICPFQDKENSMRRSLRVGREYASSCGFCPRLLFRGWFCQKRRQRYRREPVQAASPHKGSDSASRSIITDLGMHMRRDRTRSVGLLVVALPTMTPDQNAEDKRSCPPSSSIIHFDGTHIVTCRSPSMEFSMICLAPYP